MAAGGPATASALQGSASFGAVVSSSVVGPHGSCARSHRFRRGGFAAFRTDDFVIYERAAEHDLEAVAAGCRLASLRHRLTFRAVGPAMSACLESCRRVPPPYR